MDLLSQAQRDAYVGPPCPICGAPSRVTFIEVGDGSGKILGYTSGLAECSVDPTHHLPAVEIAEDEHPAGAAHDRQWRGAR